MKAVLVFRYFFWLLVFHVLTAHRQPPWSFISGLITMPYFLFTRWLMPPHVHPEIVLNGINGIKDRCYNHLIPMPPMFVQERFLRLEAEASAIIK